MSNKTKDLKMFSMISSIEGAGYWEIKKKNYDTNGWATLEPKVAIMPGQHKGDWAKKYIMSRDWGPGDYRFQAYSKDNQKINFIDVFVEGGGIEEVKPVVVKEEEKKPTQEDIRSTIYHVQKGLKDEMEMKQLLNLHREITGKNNENSEKDQMVKVLYDEMRELKNQLNETKEKDKIDQITESMKDLSEQIIELTEAQHSPTPVFTPPSPPQNQKSENLLLVLQQMRDDSESKRLLAEERYRQEREEREAKKEQQRQEMEMKREQKEREWKKEQELKEKEWKKEQDLKYQQLKEEREERERQREQQRIDAEDRRIEREQKFKEEQEYKIHKLKLEQEDRDRKWKLEQEERQERADRQQLQMLQMQNNGWKEVIATFGPLAAPLLKDVFQKKEDPLAKVLPTILEKASETQARMHEKITDKMLNTEVSGEVSPFRQKMKDIEYVANSIGPNLLKTWYEIQDYKNLKSQIEEEQLQEIQQDMMPGTQQNNQPTQSQPTPKVQPQPKPKAPSENPYLDIDLDELEPEKSIPKNVKSLPPGTKPSVPSFTPNAMNQAMISEIIKDIQTGAKKPEQVFENLKRFPDIIMDLNKYPLEQLSGGDKNLGKLISLIRGYKKNVESQNAKLSKRQ